VVAKRLDAPYAEGRRSSAWVKQKHRRHERFVVTGWRERDGALPEFFLARRVGKELEPAGRASLGLDHERREQLLSALAELEVKPVRPRRGVRWAVPEIEVLADLDGRPNGPARDAVLCEIGVPGAAGSPPSSAVERFAARAAKIA